MSFQCWRETYQPDTDLQIARVIARRLCRDSLAWARALALGTCPAQPSSPSAPDPQTTASGTQVTNSTARTEHEMFLEVLAYSLCLLDMRLSSKTSAENVSLATRVRHECYVLVEEATWFGRKHYKRLPAPDPALRHSRYQQLCSPQDADSGAHARLTREIFEQFGRCTGLGSEVLVGSGENLASLVFYIALHTVLAARGLPTREGVLRLLRTAKECRIHFQRTIPQMLAGKPNPPCLPESELVRLCGAGLASFG